MDNKSVRKIELLSPAKDLACGIEAVNHGADAVYIGAPKFGARAAASNTVADIKTLCDYAHLFGVRVYIALNTIIKEDELREAEEMIAGLYDAGADALIVQDMGITRLNIPPIALHASTQADNRTVEKVKVLEAEGFSQVILARELSLENIREIASLISSIALEVFIHGALCVSYSGQCCISEAFSRRSSNRGECAQYCRLPYTWTDADGKIIARDKHLLSLKDLNHTDNLEELLDAGVSSLKIEGRLKDMSYVKNITAWYRRKLDGIFERRNDEYIRSSAGHSVLSFEPEPMKSFNRGFTTYLLHRRTDETIAAIDTPKSIGESIGTASEIKGTTSFAIVSSKHINNGDGLVFFRPNSGLEGFRVNKVENGRVYPHEMPRFTAGTMLYRNYDHEFEKLLSRPSAVRKIDIVITFADTPSGFSLTLVDETGIETVLEKTFSKKKANVSQNDNIRQQLSRLGNTPFNPAQVTVCMSSEWFVPSSLLSEMRREATAMLESKRRGAHLFIRRTKPDCPARIMHKHIGLQYNVANSEAETFYRERGATTVEPAFELSHRKDVPLMYTRHCLRYSMGWCPVSQKNPSPYKEPFYLSAKNTKLRLEFDCKNCQMLIFAE